MPTRIPGFDALLGGGLPRGRTTLIVGAPGSGKTLFALETLVRGARDGDEPGIFVAFEESAAQVVSNASSLRWDLATLQKKRLFFLDARLSHHVIHGGPFDLLALLSGLEEKARRMGARRVVFDGIDMLLSTLGDPVAARREVCRLSDWLVTQQLSGIVTCKVPSSRSFFDDVDAYLPYLADCVIELEHEPSASVLLRRLRIAKCRGLEHVGGKVPFAITPSGLEVASYPRLHGVAAADTRRVGTGVARLDTMLRGGLYRGSSTIVSGAPGTAKSTLATAFALSSARRGDPTLYVSFDESPSEVVRNMASVGMRLDDELRAGRLRVVSARRGDRSAEEHVVWISRLLEQQKTRSLVVDPLSALVHSGGAQIAEEAAARLIAVTKALGVTLVATTLLPEAGLEAEATATGISAIADTWIHLSYLVRGGERNRALTIVKARGVGHSNQVRELVLTDRGPDLTDVFLSDGEVLMGTLRWQKEEEQAARERAATARLARARRDADLAVAETRAQIAVLEKELARRAAAVDDLDANVSASDVQAARRMSTLRSLRRADGRERERRAADAPAGAGGQRRDTPSGARS